MDTNHRLMAMTAEFSIKQATTLSIQQEIKEKEHQVRSLQHFIWSTPSSLAVVPIVASYTPMLQRFYWKLSHRKYNLLFLIDETKMKLWQISWLMNI